MKGDPKVIDYLNAALRSELTAVSQYWLHYRLQEDWGYGHLAAKSRAESIEEMHHADKMIARILRLEQLPRPADAADALAIAVCHGWRSGVGAGLDAQAATTTTHQGARTGMQRAAQERGTVLTPAQRAWQAAEQKARRGR